MDLSSIWVTARVLIKNLRHYNKCMKSNQKDDFAKNVTKLKTKFKMC